MVVTLMSYNIQHCLNYITRQIDYDMVVNTIRSCGADIVGLQEIYGQGDDPVFQPQAAILAEKLGFYHYFAEAIRLDGKNPYGIALLSRYPITAAETIPIPDPLVRRYGGYYETRCMIKATVHAGEDLHIFVSHFGLNPDEQENAVRTVIANLCTEKCVLMGDLNMEPQDPILTPIRQTLLDTADLFSAPKLSFPSDTPTVKIDYIFISKDLAAQSADIPQIVSSDHRPHLATITLQ